MDNRQILRLKVTHYYLENGVSFRQTALKFHTTYRTVFKWVKLYKEQGEERLLSTYKRPWNRAKPDMEEKIAFMKENEPGLTIRMAKKHLEEEGISISIKGIWGIWNRYGYAGFNKKIKSNNLTDCPWTKEATKKFEQAKALFGLGSIEKSAEVLNSIPALPQNELLNQFPDSLLNLRRRIEKLGDLYGRTPVRSYLKKLRILYEDCKRMKLHYSALIVGIAEIKALSWSGEPMKMLEKIEELKNMVKETGMCLSYLPFGPRFSLLISEGYTYALLLKMKKALEITRFCHILLQKRKHISPYYMRDLGQLYTILEDFRKAEYWFLKSLDKLDGGARKQCKNFLSNIFIARGEYKKAMHISKIENLDTWGCRTEKLFIQSVLSLVKGIPHEAISFATQALSVSKKEEILSALPSVYLNISSAYYSLVEKAKAKGILKRALPFLVKNHLKRTETIFKILISQARKEERPMLLHKDDSPTVTLALLLKNGNYLKAYTYAEKKGILCWFHRYIFFFPELITDLVEKGKPTGLPRAMLNLPVFRKEIPVYSVRFLGNLVVYKNQKYLRVKLAPQDTALLIHLATARDRHIALDRIYHNIWPDSQNPARNLAHLLVRIRKALCLPSHFLYIKESRLYFDCHFITDYGEYLQHLAQAKAFSVAGEWAFARSEYLHAFPLFRDAPFKKMYDNWSEEMRHTILANLENEAMKFAEACAAHCDRATGVETLQKISRIIPHSEEIKELMNNLTTN